MTFTYERYEAAFTSDAERDGFFRDAVAGAHVPPGTAMRHVMASNRSIWMDEAGLMADAARIMKHELDCWADEEGEERLTLPHEALSRCKSFRKGFENCFRIGRDDIEDCLLRERIAADPDRDVAPPPERVRAEDDPAVARALSAEFLAEVYLEACRMEDDLRRTIDDRVRGEQAYRARIARFGLDPDDLPELGGASPPAP